VLETRDVRRRRACEVCDHRFTTEEALINTAVNQKVKPEPSKPYPGQVMADAIVKRSKARTEARRNMQDVRERKAAAWNSFDEDNDFIPEKW
jgi:transcriptional regulator NrdR family protein